MDPSRPSSGPGLDRAVHALGAGQVRPARAADADAVGDRLCDPAACDERRTKTRPESILRLIRALSGGGVASLLDRAPEDWTAFLGYSSDRGYIERRFLLDAISY